MPDIATALQTALSARVLNNDIKEWHEEEENRIHPKETTQHEHMAVTPLTAQVFNYIRDNPGVTSRQVSDYFERKGYKSSSTTSLAAQFVRGGMASRDAAGRITMLAQKYAPPITKPPKLPREERNARKEDYRRRAAKRLATLAAKKEAGIAALQVQATPPQPTQTTQLAQPQPAQPLLLNMTPAQIIDALSVRQARELYAALKEFFG